MTYANLGVVIGHEIVHGFDVNGRPTPIVASYLSVHLPLCRYGLFVVDYVVIYHRMRLFSDPV